MWVKPKGPSNDVFLDICGDAKNRREKPAASYFNLPGHSRGGGGFSLTNGIRGCSKVLRCIFVSFGISMGGLSSHTQCAQFAKLGVFWKI